MDIFRATSMGFSGSLSSVEAETSQLAPARVPGLGAPGFQGLPVVSSIPCFSGPKCFTNLKSQVCRKPGTPIYNPPTRVRFLGFGVARVFSKLSWLTSQELCKNVRWLYSKQSQTDDTINSGTLGKLGCNSIYLYAIHHWFKRKPLGLGPYKVVYS